MRLGLRVAADGRRVFLELLFLHSSESRRQLESIPSRDALPLSCSPLSHRLLQLNMRRSVRPGRVLIKADKDLSPVHCSLSGRSGCWRG